jgi:ketosteroid isomerase-like protein
MKTRLLSALAGLAICFVMPVLAQEQNTVDPEVRQQIEASIMKLEEAYNGYDATAFAAAFTLDAIDWLGWEGAAISGQEAIMKRVEAEFASYPPKQSFKLVRVYPIGRAYFVANCIRLKKVGRQILRLFGRKQSK